MDISRRFKISDYSIEGVEAWDRVIGNNVYRFSATESVISVSKQVPGGFKCIHFISRFVRSFSR